MAKKKAAKTAQNVAAEDKEKKTSLEKDKKDSEKKASDKKASKKKEDKKKPNVFARMGKSISRYFRDIISEIKKIVWPTPKATFKSTGVVLLSMLIVGLVIFGLDTGLHALFGLVMDLAGN